MNNTGKLKVEMEITVNTYSYDTPAATFASAWVEESGGMAKQKLLEN